MCGHDVEYFLVDLTTNEFWGPYLTVSEARSQVERLDLGKWEIVFVDGDGLVVVVI